MFPTSFDNNYEVGTHACIQVVRNILKYNSKRIFFHLKIHICFKPQPCAIIVVQDSGGISNIWIIAECQGQKVGGLRLKSLKRAAFYDIFTMIRKVFKNKSRSEDNFQTGVKESKRRINTLKIFKVEKVNGINFKPEMYFTVAKKRKNKYFFDIDIVGKRTVYIR